MGLFLFLLKSSRLKEHLQIAGRNGPGKTDLTFILMQGIMACGIKVLALDWEKAVESMKGDGSSRKELLSWLDIS